MMWQRVLAVLALAIPLVGFSGPASAALVAGAPAPDFQAMAVVGGERFMFSLADALKHGPVVLYFFPKAFTSGCTQEAHDFAEAATSYKQAGATLLGMSSDKIDVLTQFSQKECSSKFPVAADPDLSVIRAYDAVMVRVPVLGGYSSRVSYVIGTDHLVAYAYSDLDPDHHVANTLAVVRRLHGQRSP